MEALEEKETRQKLDDARSKFVDEMETQRAVQRPVFVGGNRGVDSNCWRKSRRRGWRTKDSQAPFRQNRRPCAIFVHRGKWRLQTDIATAENLPKKMMKTYAPSRQAEHTERGRCAPWTLA